MIGSGNHPNSIANLAKVRKVFKSDEKAIKAGKKGGIASGRSKRKTKLFNGLLNDFLKNPEQNPDTIKEAILNANIPKAKKKEITNAVVIVASVLGKAKDGDLKAFELIRDTIGEKPKQDVGFDTSDLNINFTLNFK